MRRFDEDIQQFNSLYQLPVASKPSFAQLGEKPQVRIRRFMAILREELTEGEDIIAALNDPLEEDLDILTMLADWLGDMQVYCASEMAKFGLPLDATLDIIMASNLSKMGPEGPVYDERGKLLKGPEYWRPEPLIRKLLHSRIASAEGAEANGTGN